MRLLHRQGRGVEDPGMRITRNPREPPQPQQLIRSDNPFNHPISILLFAPQVHDPLHDVDLLLHLMLYALALLLVVQGPQHLLEPAVFLQQSVNAGLVVILLGVALWLVGL